MIVINKVLWFLYYTCVVLLVLFVSSPAITSFSLQGDEALRSYSPILFVFSIVQSVHLAWYCNWRCASCNLSLTKDLYLFLYYNVVYLFFVYNQHHLLGVYSSRKCDCLVQESAGLIWCKSCLSGNSDLHYKWPNQSVAFTNVDLIKLFVNC